jgi:hypothetical protein
MEIKEQTYVCFPGRIIEYFPETQTATVKVSAERVFNSADVLAGTIEREIIEDMPVHTAFGGGWSVTFPIKPDDTCLLVFSQCGYDHWLFEDKDEAGKLVGLPKPHLRRKFSNEDGFCMVGFNTLPRAIQGYSPTDSEWRNEDRTQKITLHDSGEITVDTPNTLTINAPTVQVNATEATVTASTSVTLDTPTTTITGNLNVTGVTTGSSGVFGGKTVETHTHTITGGSSAGNTTGPN